MRISVIGCGYLGAVHAVAMAKLGHEVLGIDNDELKIRDLQHGRAPFHEPQFADLLTEQLAAGRLTFSANFSDARKAQVHFIAVGTPQDPVTGAADLNYVNVVTESLLEVIRPGSIVVGKSTVPAGTSASLAKRFERAGVTLLWNPEFLREGWAVQDTLHPDRIVVGVPTHVDGTPTEDGAQAATTLKALYSGCMSETTPYIVTDWATAELVKMSANAFLATKISFINAIAEVADASGADITQLADALGFDDRIGRKFLGAGIGFGGACLPKDIRALAYSAKEFGAVGAQELLNVVDEINESAAMRFVDQIEREIGELSQARIAVLGASFKPHSDDIRGSVALWIAEELQRRGARPIVTDPVAIANARLASPALDFTESIGDALTLADAIALVTEWDEYRLGITPEMASRFVRTRLIFDGRNALNPERWRAAGWRYFSVGRPSESLRTLQG